MRESVDSDLRFHHVHGKNARITNNGLTASRPRALGEFNEAIVIANRALRDGEMFEVTIDKMVARWSGAIEAGNCCPICISVKYNKKLLHIMSRLQVLL